MRWFWVTKKELSIVACENEKLREDVVILRNKIELLQRDIQEEIRDIQEEIRAAMEKLAEYQRREPYVRREIELLQRDLQVKKDEMFLLNGKDMAWYKENTDKLLQWKQETEENQRISEEARSSRRRRKYKNSLY